MRYIITIVALLVIVAQSNIPKKYQSESNDELRLRVIANSNSAEDQRLKQEIVDEILKAYEKTNNDVEILTKEEDH